jgi:hypothetical protein
LSSDGGTLAVCERSRQGSYRGFPPRIVLYDVNSGRERGALPSPSSSLSHITFAARDRVLLAATFDVPKVHARIYTLDARNGDELAHFDARAATDEIAWSHDGRVIALQDRVDAKEEMFATRFYDLGTGQLLRSTAEYHRPLRGFVQSADGRTMAGITDDDGNLHCWEVATGKERHVFEGQRQSQVFGYSPDSARIVSAGANPIFGISGGADTAALIWEVTSRSDHGGGALAQDQLNALWADLAGEDPVRAEQVINMLVAFPQQALSLLRAHLRPVPTIARDSLERSITDLLSTDAAVNQRALARLERLGEAAEPALRRAMTRTEFAAARGRIALLLEEIDPVVFVVTAERLRTGRCLEILERLGTREARDLLSDVARGAPEAGQTRDAQGALRRLALHRGKVPAQ